MIVKTLAYACLLGNGAKEVIKDVGIQIGKKLSIKNDREDSWKGNNKN